MAVGTKINDTNSRPTMAYTQRLTQPVTTDANGNALFQISDRGQAAFVPASLDVNGVVTTFGTGLTPSDQAEIESSFSGYRVVSSGYRVYCTANVTESKGLVLMATIPDSITGTPTVASTTGTNYPEYERYALSGLEASWISKPDGNQAQNFTSFANYAQRTKSILAFSGCTASTVVAQVELIVHLELETIIGDFTSRMATPAPNANPRHATIQQNVLAAVPSSRQGSIEDRTKSFINTAMSVVETVGSYAELAEYAFAFI
jgi:hypothetical protein